MSEEIDEIIVIDDSDLEQSDFEDDKSEIFETKAPIKKDPEIITLESDDSDCEEDDFYQNKNSLFSDSKNKVADIVKGGVISKGIFNFSHPQIVSNKVLPFNFLFSVEK